MTLFPFDLISDIGRRSRRFVQNLPPSRCWRYLVVWPVGTRKSVVVGFRSKSEKIEHWFEQLVQICICNNNDSFPSLCYCNVVSCGKWWRHEGNSAIRKAFQNKAFLAAKPLIPRLIGAGIASSGSRVLDMLTHLPLSLRDLRRSQLSDPILLPVHFLEFSTNRWGNSWRFGHNWLTTRFHSWLPRFSYSVDIFVNFWICKHRHCIWTDFRRANRNLKLFFPLNPQSLSFLFDISFFVKRCSCRKNSKGENLRIRNFETQSMHVWTSLVFGTFKEIEILRVLCDFVKLGNETALIAICSLSPSDSQLFISH